MLLVRVGLDAGKGLAQYGLAKPIGAMEVGIHLGLYFGIQRKSALNFFNKAVLFIDWR